MARFKWDDDREFPLLQNMDFLGAEARWAEKQFGKGLNEFTWSEALFASVLVSARRANIMMTLADTNDWTIGWVNDRTIVEDGDVPEEGEADPTDGAPGPARSTRRGKSGGRRSSTTSASAPGSQSD